MVLMKVLALAAVLVIFIVVGITFLALNLEHANPPTAVQANTLCADHGGIKELVAPGEDGAYVLCHDGHAERTKDPTSKAWRDNTYWPWEWL